MSTQRFPTVRSMSHSPWKSFSTSWLHSNELLVLNRVQNNTALEVMCCAAWTEHFLSIFLKVHYSIMIFFFSFLPISVLVCHFVLYQGLKVSIICVHSVQENFVHYYICTRRYIYYCTFSILKEGQQT